MIDRSARLRGIFGTEGMFPGARRLCKVQARKRSRSAGRREVLQQLDSQSDGICAFKDASLWTVLSPCSGKYHNVVWVIEGDEDVAVRVYAARNGGRHPGKVSCDCGCGPDYFIDERMGSLEDATAMVRNCQVTVRKDGSEVIAKGISRGNPSRWDFQTVEQFLARADVIVIGKSEIQPHEADRPLPQVTYPAMYCEDLQNIAWLLDAEM